MRKAWIIAAVSAAAFATSGCVVVVGDDDGYFKGSKRDEHTVNGYRVLDRDGGYSRLGGDFNLRGRIGGDLSLISGDVDADDLEVGGDVSIAAGDVTFSGRVAGEASIAAGDVDWSADVGGDFDMAAGDLSVSGTISGPASMAAGDMTLSGRFGDTVTAVADTMRVDGRFDGEFLLVAADEIRNRRRNDRNHGLVEVAGQLNHDGQICARTLVIEDTADIRGTLRVWAESEPEIANGARVDNIEFEARNGRECDDLVDDI